MPSVLTRFYNPWAEEAETEIVGACWQPNYELQTHSETQARELVSLERDGRCS